jgi:hypothetical protein
MPDLNPSSPSLNDMEVDNILMGENARAAFESFYLYEPSVIFKGRQTFRFEETSKEQLKESFVRGLNYGLRKEPLDTTNQSGNPYERRFEVHGHTWGLQYVAGLD